MTTARACGRRRSRAGKLYPRQCCVCKRKGPSTCGYCRVTLRRISEVHTRGCDAVPDGQAERVEYYRRRIESGLRLFE